MTSSAQSTRNFIPIQNKYDRVVLLVDMDCFYCQVEEKLDPSLVGQPLAVVQYNAWRGGGIIAVNYAARAKGVSRHMRGDEAREQCPDIKLVKVPNVREKADLTKYREAGKEVANVLQRFTPLLERASVDEAYLDITEVVNKRLEEMNSGSFVIQPTELHNTYAVGYENIGEYIGEITARFSDPYCNDEAYQCAYDSNDVPAVRKSDIRLLIGASIASEIRAAVKDVTGYECSAGVAHNKILAKLACGLNKPNKQTILPLSQITGLFDALPVGKIKGLGGKFGEEVCERLKIRFLGQLQRFTEADLQRKFDEKNGSWLYYISRGIDLEAVVPRFYSKSIGCCKKFPGRNNITGLNTLNHWLNELANEICERLEKDIIENNRRAKNMVVSFIQEFDGEEISSSRTGPLQGYDKEILVKSSLEIIKANTSTFLRPGSSSVLNNPIKFLGISVGKFETISNAQNKLQEMFANQAAKTKKPKEEPEEEVVNSQNVIPEKLVGEKKNMLRSFLVSKKAEQGTGSTNSSTDSIPNKKDFAETNPMKSFFLNALKKSSSESQINRCETIVETDSTNQQGESDEQVTSSQSLVPEKVVVEKKNSLRTFLASNKQEQGTDSENISTEKSNPKKSFFLNALRKSNSVDQINRCENNVKTDSINQRIEESKSFFVKALKKQSPVEPNLLQDNNSIDSENDIKELEAEINLIESEFAVPSSSTSDDNETIVENNDNDQTTNETIGGKKRKYSDIDNSTSTHSETNASIDYQSSYAEYAIPELRSDLLQFSICNICNAKIPSDERLMQMHQDHHFAQQLSQQQRIEFRKEISIKIAKSAKTPPSVGKKPKKPSLNNTTLDSKTDITKFLKPSQSNSCENVSLTASTSLQAAAQMPTDMVTCPECKISVKCSEMDEHKDFHIAKNLQRKLNQLEVRTVPVVQKNYFQSLENWAGNRRSIAVVEMKFAVVLLTCVGLVASASFDTVKDVKIADKHFLEKQKFLFEIVYRIEEPLMFEEWIKYGDKFIVDKTHYTHFDFYMEKFYESYKMGALLPKGEFFGALVKTHHKQAFGLFNFFYYAKDFETFMHNVCWARMHVNEGMFVYALTLAVIHRDDFQGLILPSIYEIFPQYFFNSKFVYEAEKFDFDVWSKYVMYEKEFYDVYYKDNKYFSDNYFYMKDWKMWQWWKLMGLGEHWYSEDKFMLRENIYEFNQDSKWLSMMKDVKMFYMPVDYTRDINFFNEETTMSYFTEDLGWNAYFYYFNMDYAFFLDGKTFGLNKDRRGEYFFFTIQQLLSRYYMERLSHGFGDIPEFSWYHEIEYGYDPQLISYNGVGFSYRKNYWEVQTYGNFDMLNNIFSTINRIYDIVDMGYYKMADGTTIDLRKPESIEYIGNLMQGNIDAFDKYFFTYWYMLSHMYFADVDYNDFDVYPNVFLNFETMMRDPMFYMFYKKIADVFYRFKYHLPPYTHEELLFPGVQITDVQVDKLETYFDLVDIDVTNLLNDKMVFHDGKFVWDKTLLARQMRLNHKPFHMEFTVDSDKAQKIVIRIFLGPKFDEFGRLLSLANNRENFFELDEFEYNLVPGNNTFKRCSDEFHWTAKDRKTFTELYHYMMMAFEGKFDFPYDLSAPHNAFPDRLLLPRGWANGMPMQFFFMATPSVPDYPQFSPYDYLYASGIGTGRNQIDEFPFVYPFDRVIDDYNFIVPNMFFKDVKIYHVDTFETYFDKYEDHGKFDYNFFGDYYTKYFKH